MNDKHVISAASLRGVDLSHIAETNAAVDAIRFDNAFCRRDIADKAILTAR